GPRHRGNGDRRAGWSNRDQAGRADVCRAQRGARRVGAALRVVGRPSPEPRAIRRRRTADRAGLSGGHAMTGAEPASVEATWTPDGWPVPSRLTWRGELLDVVDVGRRWKDDDGLHLLARVVDGRVF